MIHAEGYAFLNAAMCLCALPLGGKLAGLPAPGRKPLLLSAGIGGGAALLPTLLPVFAPLAPLALPLCVALCFRRHGSGACVRCSVTTLCATLLTGGAATALVGAGMRAAIALLLAIALSWLCYLLTTLLPSAAREVRQVELRVGENAVLLPAMLDSGNLLRDPITGLPVLVAPHRAALTLFPDVPDLTELRALPLGFRLLSVRTAAGASLLPMFKPDRCRLYVNGNACEARLLVAVAGRDYQGIQALVPTAALPGQASFMS